mmetsp:Transcript_17948/g.36990  ORF Transcript_17948/g.36990 Transcript_17948/m.36990 type:complete len:293 (+) Transcript_17948:133-1011(+)
MDQDYQRIHTVEAPESMTMDRLENLNELVLAQTTQLCFRKGCCIPTINWVLLDSSNYDLRAPGAARNPFELPSVGGWIHEESTFFQRFCCHLPGCRETKFVHHAGLPPASLGTEDCHFCRIQTTPASAFLKPHELSGNIVAIHEKDNTCPTNCCCCPGNLPYLRTKDAQGFCSQVFGSGQAPRTQIFVATRHVCGRTLRAVPDRWKAGQVLPAAIFGPGPTHETAHKLGIDGGRRRDRTGHPAVVGSGQRVVLSATRLSHCVSSQRYCGARVFHRREIGPDWGFDSGGRGPL